MTSEDACELCLRIVFFPLGTGMPQQKSEDSPWKSALETFAHF